MHGKLLRQIATVLLLVAAVILRSPERERRIRRCSGRHCEPVGVRTDVAQRRAGVRSVHGHGHLHSRGRGPNNDRWGTRLRQLRPTGGTPANAINLSGTEPPIAKRRLRGVMPCVQSSRSSTRSCSGPSLGPSPSGQDYVRSVDGSAARRRRCRSRCASRWGTPPARHDRQYRR